jgi:hypothetical protein
MFQVTGKRPPSASAVFESTWTVLPLDSNRQRWVLDVPVLMQLSHPDRLQAQVKQSLPALQSLRIQPLVQRGSTRLFLDVAQPPSKLLASGQIHQQKLRFRVTSTRAWVRIPFPQEAQAQPAPSPAPANAAPASDETNSIPTVAPRTQKISRGPAIPATVPAAPLKADPQHTAHQVQQLQQLQQQMQAQRLRVQALEAQLASAQKRLQQAAANAATVTQPSPQHLRPGAPPNAAEAARLKAQLSSAKLELDQATTTIQKQNLEMARLRSQMRRVHQEVSDAVLEQISYLNRKLEEKETLLKQYQGQ